MKPDVQALPALARSSEPPRPESTGKPIPGTVQAKKESVIVLPPSFAHARNCPSCPVCVCVCVICHALCVCVCVICYS
jgi:hypothetical protein